MSVWTAVGPLVGVAVGYGAGFLSEWGRDSRAAKRSDKERSHHKQDERDAFELETIRAAVDALNVRARLATRVHLADVAAARARSDGLYGRDLLPDELSEGDRLADLDLVNAAGWLLDDEVRTRVEAARAALTTVSMSRSNEAEATRLYDQALDRAVEARDLLTERFRAIWSRSAARS